MASWKGILPWPFESYSAHKLAFLYLFDFSGSQKLHIPISRRPLKTAISAWEPLLARIDGCALLFFTIAHSKGDSFTRLIYNVLKTTSEEHDVLRSFLENFDRLQTGDVESASEIGVQLRKAFIDHEVPVTRLKEFSMCVLGTIIIPFYQVPQSQRVITPLSVPTEIGEIFVDPDYSSDVDALQQTIHLRDNKKCPLSQVNFTEAGGNPVLTSIIPCSFGKPSKYFSLQVLEKFWEQDDLANYLNTAQNFLILDANTAYQTFPTLEVAIEAMQLPGRPVQYICRHIDLRGDHELHVLEDGTILPIGETVSGGLQNQMPHPDLCNLRLAISRVAHMSGAVGFLSNVFGDEDCLRRAGLSEHGLYLNQARAIDSLFFKKLAFEAFRIELERAYVVSNEF